ncbi:FtsX-like permease family protein, partial [Salmonella enterica]|nr:FtsX-like permease family protein [Salmonella enterica]
NAERIGAIAQIFPVFFFLLAALISLTTMTRMVDEGRSQIGTMKALGYSNLDISLKYFVYAFLATISGAMIGLGLGYWIFPSVIMDA